MVQSHIFCMIKTQLSFSPQLYLLNMIQFEKKDKNIEIRCEFVVLLLVAAHLLIVQYWKSNMIPTKEEGCAKAWNIMLMHKLSAIVEYIMGHVRALTQFKDTWKPFVEYCVRSGKGHCRPLILDV